MWAKIPDKTFTILVLWLFFAPIALADWLPTSGGAAIENVVEDTTPQLGGNLDGQTYDISTTGTINGGLLILSKSANYTLGTGSASEAYGGVVYATATMTLTLPAVADGMHGCIYSTTAAAVHVDPNASDRFILDGTALADGDKLTSASGAGDYICWAYDSASGYATWGRAGTWTDGN